MLNGLVTSWTKNAMLFTGVVKCYPGLPGKLRRPVFTQALIFTDH